MTSLTNRINGTGRRRVNGRVSPLALACMLAVGAMVLPPTPAYGQSARLVQVTRDKTDIRLTEHTGNAVVMTADLGTVLEVIHTDGDRFAHREDNWYWVLLPRDAWGTQRAGWISGRYVEVVLRDDGPPAALGEPAPATGPRVVMINQPSTASEISSAMTAASATPAPAPAPAAPSEVVLHFEFAKSDLTVDAEQVLADAVDQLPPDGVVSLAVEGHADAIGSDTYNKELGLARAETVRRVLTERHHIPAGRIGVISYGEAQPAASNSTDEGRALNRRVVVKIGR